MNKLLPLKVLSDSVVMNEEYLKNDLICTLNHRSLAKIIDLQQSHSSTPSPDIFGDRLSHSHPQIGIDEDAANKPEEDVT